MNSLKIRRRRHTIYSIAPVLAFLVILALGFWTHFEPFIWFQGIGTGIVLSLWWCLTLKSYGHEEKGETNA